MKKRYFSLAAAIAGGSAFVALGYPFFKLIVCGGSKKTESALKWFSLKHTKVNHPRNGYEDKYEAGKAWCMAQPMEDWYLRTGDGLKLHAYYLKAKDPERIVLLSHGYRGSGFGDFANTAKFLHENGCDLLFIDQRCCGKSEGEFITFGAKEQWDVLRWTQRLAEKNFAHLPIYLYGESMGAATFLMTAGHKLPVYVKGLISDCGFCSMKHQLRDIASEWFHIHWIELLLLRVDLFCRLLGGFKMSEADTKEAMRQCNLPVLFFHGEEDSYVKSHNSVINHERCHSEKELVIIPGARHICSPYVDEKLYRNKLMEFFKKHDKG